PLPDALPTSPVTGPQYPHAVALAQGLRLQGSAGVVVVYGGAGSPSEGDWHEAMNWAGSHRLPVIFVIENNQYAITVPVHEEVAGPVADRDQGYGFPGLRIDGHDVFETIATMREAGARARAGEGPTLIEAMTYRYYAHTSDDNDALYRDREEVEAWKKKDPLARLRSYLIENRLLTEEQEMKMDQEV